MIGITLYNVIKKNIGMGGAKPRAYCGMKGGAWCNAYVCYGFNQAGARNLYYGGKKVTYCPTSIKWCQANLAQIPMYWAMAGDVIYFDWNANNVPDHIGFVKSKISSATIATHGGNTNGGKVAEKTRPAKYVLGVFRPLYNPTCSKAKLVVDGDFGYQSIYMLQCALGITPNGILNKATVKALQKKIGVAQDGAIGRKSALALQKFLKVKQDGAIGKDTTVALQKWINAVCYPNVSSGSTATKQTSQKQSSASSQVTAKSTTLKTYGGTFPSIPKAKIAECTRSVNGMRKHDLLAGDYILRFKSEERRYKMCKFALATVGNKKITYSNHPAFESKVKAFGYNLAKVKALKTSANCSNFVDGCVGAVTGKYVRDLGAKHNKAYLGKTNFFNSYKYSKGALLAGDICGTPKHTWVIIQGSALSVGCEGADVKRLQSFLNWAGFNCGTPDGDFGMKTLAAVKAFQKKVGLTIDGICGSKTIQKARAYKK